MSDLFERFPHTKPVPSGPPRWGPARRILFRFAFAYLLLFNLVPLPLMNLPHDDKFIQPYMDLWDAGVPWVGKHVFHVDVTVRPNGSGDTTYNYIQLFCYLVLAAAAAGVWTLLDRKRTNYVRLNELLRVYLRFVLGTTMILYGGVKIIKSQFPEPSLDRLVEPFGQASPMGLLWTFMGASVSYNVFSGAGEILGGLLLTARRTTLLGALLCIGLLANVVVLNFSYDVPVKQFSCHLLAMAVFLAAPDLRRLANFFLFNRTVERAELRPLFRWKWLHRGGLVLRTGGVLAFTGLVLVRAQQGRETYGDRAPRSPLYGIWNVEEFAVDGEVRPALVTDETRWRRVIFDHPGILAIQPMNDSRQRYLLRLDWQEKALDLSKHDDPEWDSTLTFEQPEPGRLVLEGTFDGRTVRANLRRIDRPEFLLLDRGFHWINEYPFNR